MNNQTNKRKCFHKLIRICNEKWIQIKCDSVLGFLVKISFRIHSSKFHVSSFLAKIDFKALFQVKRKKIQCIRLLFDDWCISKWNIKKKCAFIHSFEVFIQSKSKFNYIYLCENLVRAHHKQHTYTYTNDNKWWWLWMDLAKCITQNCLSTKCARSKHQMNIYCVGT